MKVHYKNLTVIKKKGKVLLEPKYLQKRSLFLSVPLKVLNKNNNWTFLVILKK